MNKSNKNLNKINGLSASYHNGAMHVFMGAIVKKLIVYKYFKFFHFFITFRVIVKLWQRRC
jgi:hypothetical protein